MKRTIKQFEPKVMSRKWDEKKVSVILKYLQWFTMYSKNIMLRQYQFVLSLYHRILIVIRSVLIFHKQ